MRRMIIRTLATNSGTSVLGLMNAILLSRWLGAAGRGEIAAAFLWPGLLIYLGSMGLIISTMYFSSQPRANVSVVLNNAIVLGLLLGALAAAFGFFAMPWLLHSQSASVVAASRWYVLVIPISLLAQCGLSILQGRLQLKAVNWLNTIIPSGYLLGTIILMSTGKLVLINVVILHLVLNLVVLVSTFSALVKLRFSPGLETDTRLARSMLGYGAKLHVGQLSGFANLNLDQALIAAWLPPAALGFYVVAVSTAGISLMLSSAVQTVAMPSIAREENPEARRRIFERAFNRYWWLSLVFVLALAVAFPILIPVVYGQGFRSSVAPAEVLLIGAFFMGARLLLSGGAVALGDPWVASKASLVALPVTVLLLCLLLPTLGLMGAALASALAYFVEFVVVVFGLRRKHEVSLASLFRLRFDGSESPMQSPLARLAERT